MKSYNPRDKWDRQEAVHLEAQPWQLAALRYNPSYCGWGPHEDYMIQRDGEDRGWASNQVIASWPEFKWTPDELNLFANFYFEINRENKPCDVCNGIAVHPDGQWISESFYHHSSPFTEPTTGERQGRAVMERWCEFCDPVVSGRPDAETIARYGKPFADFVERTISHGGAWNDDITEDEAEALVESRGRYTAAQWNAAQKQRGITDPMSHDAINRGILIAQRCKRLGVPHYCTKCDGHGYLFTAPARLDLILWVLHPRKGCGRAVSVQNIQPNEVKLAVAFLKRCYRDFTKNNWKRILRRAA